MSILKSALKIIRGPKKAFPGGCLACGTCCELLGPSVRADEEDRKRWEREGREDILLWVATDGSLTKNLATGEDGSPCPFLCRKDDRHSLCSINETKPALCRSYPAPVHGGRCVLGRKSAEGKS